MVRKYILELVKHIGVWCVYISVGRVMMVTQTEGDEMKTMDAAVAMFCGVCGVIGAVCFGIIGQWWVAIAVGVCAASSIAKGVRKLRA
jgi:hypothetical protein